MMVLLMLEQYRDCVWYNTLTPSDLVTIALLVIVFGINRFIDLEYRVIRMVTVGGITSNFCVLRNSVLFHI